MQIRNIRLRYIVSNKAGGLKAIFGRFLRLFTNDYSLFTNETNRDSHEELVSWLAS